MKKAFTISLLLFFVLEITGFYPVFKLSQWNLRKEMKSLIKAGVPESELHVLPFSRRDLACLTWEREGKEFRKNGQMFDVVRRVDKKDTVILYCVNDKQESVLFANLDEILSKNAEKNGHHGKISKLLTLTFVVPEKLHAPRQFYVYTSFPSCIVNSYKSPSEKIKLPPPRFI